MRNKLIANLNPKQMSYGYFMALRRNAVVKKQQLQTLKLVVILVIASMAFLMTCVPAPA